MKINVAINALQSLAQETRLEVFRLLVRAGQEGVPAGEIAVALDVPAPTLSFHLNHLSNAGLIEVRRDGRQRCYTVCFDQVRDLLGFLMEDCCQGRAELCAPVSTACCINNEDTPRNDACC